MIVKMIKTEKGFLIPDLKGFDNINKEIITVDIKIKENFSYKELKEVAILEKFKEKQKRLIDFSKNISEMQKEFRKKIGYRNMSLDELLEI